MQKFKYNISFVKIFPENQEYGGRPPEISAALDVLWFNFPQIVNQHEDFTEITMIENLKYYGK